MNHDALEEVILAVAREIAERQDFLKYLHAARDRKRATEHPSTDWCATPNAAWPTANCAKGNAGNEPRKCMTNPPTLTCSPASAASRSPAPSTGN